MKLKVLITGSSGMLGMDLAKELRKDYDVFGVDLVRSIYKADITNRQSIASVIKEVSPDIVIHTAALTDVDGCERDKKKAYRINSDGTKNVALACKSVGAVLVYISTDFVFDGKKKRPYLESDKTGPLGVYADSKLRGEAAVKKVLKKYFILRTSWLYGKNGKNFVAHKANDRSRHKICKANFVAHKANDRSRHKICKTNFVAHKANDRSRHKICKTNFVAHKANDRSRHKICKANFVDTIVAKAKGLGCLKVVDDQVGSPTYTIDLAKAIHRLIDKASTQYARRDTQYGVYHITNLKSVSWYEYARTIVKLAKVRAEVLPISSDELDRPAKRPAMSVLDNSKFMRFTGYKMRDWKTALKEYLRKS